jgi:hypothetical protein
MGQTFVEIHNTPCAIFNAIVFSHRYESPIPMRLSAFPSLAAIHLGRDATR